jgi:SAM-dependent methyltransferase
MHCRLPALLLALFWGMCAAATAQPRAPTVRFEATPMSVVQAMMDLAAVKAGDVVYDLGCGDGRIVVAAAQLGARAVCVDIDPLRITEAQENARKAGVAGRIEFRNEDLFGTGLREATVVMLFLSLDFNMALRPRLQRELRPGSRVVSHWHRMGSWKPQKTVHMRHEWRDHEIFLWVIDDK